MGTDRLHDVICYIIFYFKKCSEINKNENPLNLFIYVNLLTYNEKKS